MMCADSLPAVAGAAAAAIAQGRNDQEIALLAAFFTQIGDSLALLLVARECNNKTDPPAIAAR